MYSNIKGGVNSLPNGGFMICETIKGRFTEVDPAGNVVWVYINPADQAIYNQFDVIAVNDNMSFRAEPYPLDYVGIVGNDVTPTITIENQNSLSDACSTGIGLNENALASVQFVNPVVNKSIHLVNGNGSISNVKLYDMSGRFIQHWAQSGNAFEIAPVLEQGFYLLHFEKDGISYQERLLIE
jgi:hypothetical protein